MRSMLVLLTCVVMILSLSPGMAGAKSCSKEKPTVRVTPKDAQPMLIKDFTQGGYTAWGAIWRGSRVELCFGELKKVVFLEPGSSPYRVKIFFKNGKSDEFVLDPNGEMHGMSEFGSWYMSHKNAVDVVFDPGEGDVEAISSPSPNADQIKLKNTDLISGEIVNPNIKLRTSYGSLVLPLHKIASIVFEGGGANVDSVVLRLGTR